MYVLDDTDKQILKLLQADAKMTIREIATRLHLSTSPIFDRIKRLEKAKVITKYTAVVDPELLGKNLVAFVEISLDTHGKAAVDQFAAQIIAFPEVMECHHVSGQADFILKVLIKDMNEYNSFVLDRLSEVKNVGKVESRFSLSTRKFTTEVAVE